MAKFNELLEHPGYWLDFAPFDIYLFLANRYSSLELRFISNSKVIAEILE